MSAKHTQGPWEIWPNSQSGQVCVGHLESHSNLVRAVCEVDSDDMDNARLIAAAPDLLAAAEAAIDYIAESLEGEYQIAESDDLEEQDYLERKQACLDSLRAAIARAKG